MDDQAGESPASGEAGARDSEAGARDWEVGGDSKAGGHSKADGHSKAARRSEVTHSSAPSAETGIESGSGIASGTGISAGGTPAERRRAEELEREILELCGHLNAGEYRFLELVAEFDRDRHWEWWHGVANCAQWLSLMCGFDRVAASERVRVARALEQLPKTRALFGRGELSYSKVRAMTRVATPQNEEALVTVAQFGTAQHIERLVRSYRRFERVEEAEQAEARAAARHVHYRYDEDGSLIIYAKLPPEVGEIVQKAIDAAVEVLYRDGVQREKPAEGESEAAGQNEPADQNEAAGQNKAESGVSAGNSMADETGTRSDETQSADETQTQSNVSAGNTAVDETRARSRDESRTRSNVSAGNTDESQPRLDQSHLEHSAAEEFAGERWVDTLGARRADGLALIAERYLSGDAQRQGSSADRYQVVVHIDQALLAAAAADGAGPDTTPRHPPHRLPLFDRCELESGQALAIETARRLACDASLVGLVEGEDGEPLSVGRKTRGIPPSLARALKARDRGCRFPGCGRTRFTHGHHVVHWADGGETKLRNLITLCTYHHRLVHEGGFGVRATDDGAFIFTRPDGSRIDENGRSRAIELGVLPGGAAARSPETGRPTLFGFNRRRGLDVEADAAACRWLGERMDYNIAIAYMAACRDEARRGGPAGTAGRQQAP